MDLATARQIVRRPSSSRVDPGDYYSFDGGLNLVDTPLKIKPGEAVSAQNYDLGVEGGYKRCSGYERIDGRTKASDTNYYTISFTAGIPGNYPPLGGTVTTATGSAVLLQVISGTSGQIVLGRLTGSMTAAQALKYSAITFATASSAAAAGGGPSAILDRAYKVLAEEDQRALITVVPGAGRILGVVVYNGVTYAFRNHTDNLSARMYQETSSGWSQINLGTKLKFNTGGTTAIAAGDTLTGATSGATSTVRRVVLQSGTWGASNAVGYLILSGVTGTYTGTENLQVGGVTRAHHVSSAAQALAPDGRFEFRIHNFYGHSSSRRLYGVDGKNFAFEFQDGATGWFVGIETGMTTDTPLHLEVWLGSLWLAFSGGSLQKSGVNDPVVITVVTGAAEFAVGDEITGLYAQSNTTMFVMSRNRIDYMLGTSVSDIALKPFNSEVGQSGMLEWSFQNIAGGIYLDDRGFTNLAAAQEYGNFKSSTFSSRIEPLLNDIRSSVTASVLVRQLNIYRLFLSDGRFVTIGTRNSKIVGFMVGSYGVSIQCAYSGEDTAGNEKIVMGGLDGYVYQAESGRNFDGDAIAAYLKLAFNPNRSPGVIKRYRRAAHDIKAEGIVTVRIQPLYTFSRSDVSSDSAQAMGLITEGGIIWNITIWNDPSGTSGVSDASMKLEGSGENIGFLYSSNSASDDEYSVDGVTLHKSQRRLERGSRPR